jgi:selenide,water dikinase
LSALTLPYAKPAILGRDLLQLREGLNSLGAPVIGGHTAEGAELSAALTVIGETAPNQRTAASGQVLILTKPLGVGLVLAARMLGRVHPLAVQAVMDHCQQDNAAAATILARHTVGLRTDVTGFGLLGHLQTSLPSGVGAKIDGASIPILAGALEAYRLGVRPTILSANQSATASALSVSLTPQVSAILHDPQTSGGLLVSVARDEAQAVISALHAAGYTRAHTIGVLNATSKLEVTDQWA